MGSHNQPSRAVDEPDWDKDFSLPRCSHINVGTGVDITIRELAEIMARVVGFEGEICFDTSKPDGISKRLMDVSRLKNLEWQYSVNLEAGLTKTYQWFSEQLRSCNEC